MHSSGVRTLQHRVSRNEGRSAIGTNTIIHTRGQVGELSMIPTRRSHKEMRHQIHTSRKAGKKLPEKRDSWAYISKYNNGNKLTVEVAMNLCVSMFEYLTEYGRLEHDRLPPPPPLTQYAANSDRVPDETDICREGNRARAVRSTGCSHLS